METHPKIALILRVLSILILVGMAAGCTAVGGIGDFERTRLPINEEGADSFGFQTATPPANPDLRGEEFPVVMFVSDIEGYAHSLESITSGVLDGVMDLNAQGGMNGARLNLEVVEISEGEEEILETVTATLEESKPLLVLMAAPVDELLYYEINHQQVPFLYFGLGGEKFEPPPNQKEMLFWLVPTPDEQLSFFVRSLWTNWETVRPAGIYNELKVGYLEEADDQPDKFIETSIIKLEGDGFKVPVRWAVPNLPNASVTNFLIDAVQNGVTVLYSDTSSLGTAVLLNDLGSLALEKTFLTGGSVWSMDAGANEQLLTGGLADGYTLVLSTTWWDEADNPAIQMAAEIHNAAGRTSTMQDAGYLIGLGSVDLLREVIQAWVDQNDSVEISPEDVYQELVRLEDYNVMGGLFTISYADGSRAPSWMRLWQYRGSGGWAPLSEWGEIP